MKKFLLLIMPALVLFAGVTPVLAQPDIGLNSYTKKIGTDVGYNTDQNQYSLSQTVGRVIKIALSLVGTIFLVLTVYAGILWMTASGEAEQLEKAQKILKTSVLGLIIVIAGYGLTLFTVAALMGAAQGQVGTQNFWSAFSQSFKSNWSQF